MDLDLHGEKAVSDDDSPRKLGEDLDKAGSATTSPSAERAAEKEPDRSTDGPDRETRSDPPASGPVTAPPESDVVLKRYALKLFTQKELDESNLPGADDDVDTEAGTKALPLEPQVPLKKLTSPKRTPELARWWQRIGEEDRKSRKRLVRYVISRGKAEDVAEDIVSHAFVRALAASAPLWPEEGKSLYPTLRRYANWSSRENGMDSRQSRREIATEDMDSLPAADPVVSHDRVEQVRRLTKELSETPEDAMTASMWQAKAANNTITFAEASTAAGLAPATGTKRMQRWGEKFKTRWAEYATGVFTTVAVLVLLLCVPQGDVKVGAGNGPHANDPLPALDSAQELRASGLELCEQRSYAACVKMLDRAKELDPKGNMRPEVVKAREKAARAATPGQP
jgi:DNA-directed RNA polymerase specialized sigma24 family protein